MFEHTLKGKKVQNIRHKRGDDDLKTERDPISDWARSDLRHPDHWLAVSVGHVPCFKTGLSSLRLGFPFPWRPCRHPPQPHRVIFRRYFTFFLSVVGRKVLFRPPDSMAILDKIGIQTITGQRLTVTGSFVSKTSQRGSGLGYRVQAAQLSPIFHAIVRSHITWADIIVKVFATVSSLHKVFISSTRAAKS